MRKAVANDQLPPVPLTLEKTIVALRKGYERFEREGPDDDDAADAFAVETYRPHHNALTEWVGPAASYKDAIEALKLAADDAAERDYTPRLLPMIKAALEYLQEPRQAYLLQTPTCSRQRCPQRAKLETVK